MKQERVLTAAPEHVIWSYPVTKGFFKKTVVETRTITNYRVIQNSVYVGLGLLDDIVVMNQHRVSESNYTSVGGMRGAPRIGTGKSKSRTVGDIAFIYQGKPHFIFRQIDDPQGVARLAKAARKTVIANIKTAEKIRKAQLQEQERLQQKKQKQRTSRTMTITSNKVIITCARCSSTNTEDSRYCNNCGFRLADDDGNAGIMNQRPSSTASVVTMSPSPPSIKTSEQDVNSFKTCELPAYGVKINYPSNWRVGKGPTPSTFVIFQSPKESPSDILFESVGISSHNITNVTLEQIVQSIINNSKKRYHDFSLIESVPTKLAGRQAHRIVFDGGGKRYMSVITIEKNKGYQVMYAGEPAKYGSYLPIVKKMLGSFEIIRAD